MNLADARMSLKDTIHSPVRLTLMAALNTVDSADYQSLREQLEISYSLLSKHAAILEQAGYVKITKTFHARTPTTRLKLTHAGRQAFKHYLVSLDRIMHGLTK